MASGVDLTSGVAIASAVVGVAAYTLNRRATSARTFLDFRAQYDSEKLSPALRAIGQLGRSEIDLEVSEFHKHRRPLSSYFQRLCQLRREGYIRRRDFLVIARSQGSLLMIAPIAALEWDLNRRLRGTGSDPKTAASFDRSLRQFLKYVKMLDSAVDYRVFRGRIRRLWHCRSVLLVFESRCLARPPGRITLPQ